MPLEPPDRQFPEQQPPSIEPTGGQQQPANVAIIAPANSRTASDDEVRWVKGIEIILVTYHFIGTHCRHT